MIITMRIQVDVPENQVIKALKNQNKKLKREIDKLKTKVITLEDKLDSHQDHIKLVEEMQRAFKGVANEYSDPCDCPSY